MAHAAGAQGVGVLTKDGYDLVAIHGGILAENPSIR
jgi:hypothetical protein